MSIAYKNGSYYAYHGKDLQVKEVLKSPSEQIWMPLRTATKYNSKDRYDPYFGYKIKKGDIVKFGRVRFRIKNISSYSKEEQPNNKENHTEVNGGYGNVESEGIDHNENSQHSFGSSAMLEMKKHVNEFFNQCHSELSDDKKRPLSALSNLSKPSFIGDRQCRICL